MGAFGFLEGGPQWNDCVMVSMMEFSWIRGEFKAPMGIAINVLDVLDF